MDYCAVWLAALAGPATNGGIAASMTPPVLAGIRSARSTLEIGDERED